MIFKTLLALIPVALLGFHPSAQAYELGGATIDMSLFIPLEDGEDPVQTTDEIVIGRFFNRANCVCPDKEFQVQFSLGTPPDSLASEPVQLWLGTECDSIDPTTVASRCIRDDADIGDIDELRRLVNRSFSVKNLIAGNQMECPINEQSRNVFAIIDDNQDGFDEGGEDHSFSLAINTDTQAPNQPLDIKVTGGEGSINVSWDLPTNAEDINFFQLLCAREDGVAESFDSHTEQYLTARMACESANVDDGTTPVPASNLVSTSSQSLMDGGLVDAGSTDAGTSTVDAGTPSSDLPATLAELNPNAICGQAAGIASELKASGLENGVRYRIVLAVVDQARNVSAFDLGVATPEPVTDGWEQYLDNGGQAKGEYCFVATAAYGDYEHPWVLVLRDFRDHTLAQFGAGQRFIDWYYREGPAYAAAINQSPARKLAARVVLFPLVAAAVLWEYSPFGAKMGLFIAMLLLGLRRRHKKGKSLVPGLSNKSAKAASMLLIGLGLSLAFSARASAQSYWDDYNQETASAGKYYAKWNVDLRFGPYHPNVDQEEGLVQSGSTPFETIYGDGPSLMSGISLDRFIYSGLYGQLGVSGAIGYMSTSAKALQAGGTSNNDLRSTEDTTFRLIPTSLSVVYRASILDESFGIPFVPYGKFGVAYYFWRFSGPSGLSQADDNSGRGGSLGWQGSLGIALRAERIDKGAATSLQNELGIAHAGFFAEYTVARVDGFGNDDRLHVGDSTFFGGINFEF